MSRICIHWREQDYGERCLAAKRRCTCSGTQGQCDFKQYFNATESEVEKARREEAAERTAAVVEPFAAVNRGET